MGLRLIYVINSGSKKSVFRCCGLYPYKGKNVISGVGGCQNCPGVTVEETGQMIEHESGPLWACVRSYCVETGRRAVLAIISHGRRCYFDVRISAPRLLFASAPDYPSHYQRSKPRAEVT